MVARYDADENYIRARRHTYIQSYIDEASVSPRRGSNKRGASGSWRNKQPIIRHALLFRRLAFLSTSREHSQLCFFFSSATVCVFF